jgi:hypothetical protein
VTPGTAPEGAAETAYLTGVQHGWHAVAQDALKFAATMSNGVRVAQAECGAFVRVSKHGAYVRSGYPVMHEPCPVCAWTVAVATDATEAELDLITPDFAVFDTLAGLGLDPLLPGKLVRALLAAAEDRSDPAVIRQLAAVTAHSPGLAVSEACAEGDCGHGPCTGGRAVCWTCSLRSGEEAGEWAGTLMEQCSVAAPCSVLTALAAHYGIAAVGGRSLEGGSDD